MSVLLRALSLTAVAGLVACANTGNVENVPVETPTVDYVERLDVYSAPHQDSFLNQLAMNYRSYAIYNARTSGYPDVGELFANKAIAAFSGETPFPEQLDNWSLRDDTVAYELYTAYNEMIELFRQDATEEQPQLAAEVQAKFDCWLSATATNQYATAQQCKERFKNAVATLRDCDNGKVVDATSYTPKSIQATGKEPTYYPETAYMDSMRGAGRVRDSAIVVNNLDMSDDRKVMFGGRTAGRNLIQPMPIQPIIFNQNIYSNGDACACSEPESCECSEPDMPTVSEEFVTRKEFIDMMMAMRAELKAINARLDKMQSGEKTMIKVQQIPLEPQQHVMEEIFEVRFDFDKSIVKPEYKALIEQLASATQENKNIKVSVVGHTDTAGSKSYNYALGGRRAEAVQKMLIKYGIPASQIVAVSAGEEDLKVPTPDGVPNAENRRVRVVKETHYMQEPEQSSISIEVNGCDDGECVEE